MIDWQTPAAVGVGLLAAAHLVKRWWPTWQNLLRPHSAPSTGGITASNCESTATACGQGSGCGNCASSSPTPTKDHRIQVVRKPGA